MTVETTRPAGERLLLLAQISRRLHGAKDQQEVLSTLAEEAKRVIGAHQSVASAAAPDEPFHVISSVDLSERYAAWRSYDEELSGEGIYLLPIQDGKSYRLTQTELEAHPAWRGFGAARGRHPPMRGWLAVPLIARNGRNLGLLQLSDRYEGDFTEEDEALALQLADTASLALENAFHLSTARAAEERLRRYLDSSLDLICTVDGAGCFREVSANCVQILGYSPAELTGKSYRSLLHPEDLAPSDFEEAEVKAGRPSRTFTNRYRRADGGIAYLHWSSAWSEADQLFYCIVRDLTERIALEERLHRAERMKALGDLTGGVAHDFNNLLTIIIGSAEALAGALEFQPDLLELAQVALSAGERGAELTSHLLAFARRQSLEPKLIDLPGLIRSLEPLIRRSLGSDVRLRFHHEDEALGCVADPGQLEAALINLCVNAREAMPGGGALTITTGRFISAGPFVSGREDLEPGSYAVVTVADTGCGMSPATAERAFEPFFTTKPVGKGTGLGLSMVYGFIRQSGGAVRIYSEPGLGASVKLYLPLSEAGAAAAVGEGAEPGGSERILLVEDDALLRRQLGRQLEALGYRVTVAENGREALQRLDEDSGFDLLLSDIVMPGGISGRDLADHASSLAPPIRVLLTSGYSEDVSARDAAGARPYPMLNKPYRRAALARKLREVLDLPEPA